MQKKSVKITRVVWDMLANRQSEIDTHTDRHVDVLITILRHRCCGQSN